MSDRFEKGLMREQGKTYKEIGEAFGITAQAVQQSIGRFFPFEHIKVKHTCKGCGGEFYEYESRNKKFCKKGCLIINNIKRCVTCKNTENLHKITKYRRKDGNMHYYFMCKNCSIKRRKF